MLPQPSARTDSPPWLQQLQASPFFQDTLTSLLVNQPQIQFMGPAGQGIQAQGRVEGKDLIRFWGESLPTDSTARSLFAHEVGHILNLQRQEQLDFSQMAFAVRQAMERTPGMPDNAGYEYFADAFSDAVLLLSHTAQQPQIAKEVLQAAEEARPGTSIMANYLLQFPIYQQHPLRELLTPPASAATVPSAPGS